MEGAIVTETSVMSKILIKPFREGRIEILQPHLAELRRKYLQPLL